MTIASIKLQGFSARAMALALVRSRLECGAYAAELEWVATPECGYPQARVSRRI